MEQFDFRAFIPKVQPAKIQEEFVISAVGLNHGHIYNMVSQLIQEGAKLKFIYDEDEKKIASFLKRYPMAKKARCLKEVMEDEETKLILTAAITSERCALGLMALAHGKDFFTAKAPFTTLAQLEEAKKAVEKTKGKWFVNYSERLHSESALLTGYLLAQNVIGQVLQVTGLGPHRLGNEEREPWFFQKEKYGGILCDIGSHQIEQYLTYAKEKDARVVASRISNYAHPAYPELDDFGDCSLTGQNGTSCYFRVDWFTPNGLQTWGDGRTFVLGTQGYIEQRKYANIANGKTGGNHLYLVNQQGEYYIDATGLTGFPFYRQLILDCLYRTEEAMTQAHTFKAAQLCLLAQAQAEVLSK